MENIQWQAFHTLVNQKPHFFKYLVSKYYPLNDEIIVEYAHLLDWELLSENKQMHISFDTIVEFLLIFDGAALIQLENLPWDDKLIKLLGISIWDSPILPMKVLSENKGIRWDEKLMKYFSSLVYWPYITRNTSAHWSHELVLKITNQATFIQLSENPTVEWSAELIAQKRQFWDWKALSANPGLPWSIDLVNEFLEYWDWHQLSKNVNVPWDAKWMASFEHVLDWQALSANSNVLWSEEILNKYTNQLNWHHLSKSRKLEWSHGLLAKYQGRWNWDNLSCNLTVPRTMETISTFFHRWNWSSFCSYGTWSEKELSAYINIIEFGKIRFLGEVSEAFLIQHIEKWNWSDLIHYNSDQLSSDLQEVVLPRIINEDGNYYHFRFTKENMIQFKDIFNWEELSENENLPWSAELIISFLDYWNYDFLKENEVLAECLFDDLPVNKLKELLDHIG